MRQRILSIFDLSTRSGARRSALIFAALILIPFLGSSGLTSPWEAQYAEVAREMTANGNYVYPKYRNVGFFSKPILTMWLTSPGLSLTGGWEADGMISEWTSFAVRLPMVLLLLFCFFVMFWAVDRIWDHRAAFASVMVGTTAPFILLAGRQAVTDMPFFAAVSAALFALMGYLFGPEDDSEAPRVDMAGVWVFSVLAGLLFELVAGSVVPALHSGWRVLGLLVAVSLAFQVLQRLAQKQFSEGERRWLCLRGDGDDGLPVWFLALLIAGVALQAFWYLSCPEEDPLLALRFVRIPSRVAVVVGMFVVCAVLLAQLRNRPRSELPLYGFYALVGVATLAKGFGGVLVPGGVALGYIIAAWDWGVLKRVRLITGPLTALLLAAPWFLIMFAYPGRDEEHKTFYSRFVVHDHLRRLGGGIHGDSSKRGLGFTYHIRYLAYGLFPWVLALPAVLGRLVGHKQAKRGPQAAEMFLVVWLVVSFLLFTLMSTKFHHYGLPVVAPLIPLIGVWLAHLSEDRAVWTQPLAALTLLLGVAIAGDLIRFPWEWMDLTTYHYINYKPADYFPSAVGGQCDLSTTYCWFMGIIPLTIDFNWPVLVAIAVGSSSALVVIASLWGAYRQGGGLLQAKIWLASGLITAVFVAHLYFPVLSQHWTHATLVNTYFKRRQPSDPLIAYQMNWHGETFYARNLEWQINDSSRLKQIVNRPGTAWVLVEQSRFDGMKKTLGAKYKERIHIADRSNVKWYLVRVDD
jgi:4-amino-4-deoxy-L-arabinose transferase-like glycosyltransferase